jgi:hypothetical protein
MTFKWTRLAACRDADPNIFFPDAGVRSEEAEALCAVCCVRRACSIRGEGEQVGIWGGEYKTSTAKRSHHGH